MQQQSEGVAKIAGYCAEMGSDFHAQETEAGGYILEVRHRGGGFTIVPSGSYFAAHVSRRLTNIDGYPIEESEPIVDLDSELVDVADALGTHNISLEVLTATGPNDTIDYYDGYEAIKPLFVHDGFSLRDFDEGLMELEQISRAAFRQTNSDLDIETDLDEASGTGDESGDSAPAFQ